MLQHVKRRDTEGFEPFCFRGSIIQDKNTLHCNIRVGVIPKHAFSNTIQDDLTWNSLPAAGGTCFGCHFSFKLHFYFWRFITTKQAVNYNGMAAIRNNGRQGGKLLFVL